jgi:hypothetical protein
MISRQPANAPVWTTELSAPWHAAATKETT